MPVIDEAEVRRRFTFYPPNTPQRIAGHEAVRTAFTALANRLTGLPEGREKSLAFTELEQAMFWANAAIARQPDVVEPVPPDDPGDPTQVAPV